MITQQQADALEGVKNAILAVDEAFPDDIRAKLLHGMAHRLLQSAESEMTSEQYATSGGNEKDGQ